MADAPACENCARDESAEKLAPVRRVYLALDEWGEEEPKATVVDEVERWCLSCRSIYPHEDVTESA